MWPLVIQKIYFQKYNCILKTKVTAPSIELTSENLQEKLENINNYIQTISNQYNIDKKNIIKDFLNYIIRNHPKYLSNSFLNFVENLMHSQIQNNNIYVNYSLTRLSSFISK